MNAANIAASCGFTASREERAARGARTVRISLVTKFTSATSKIPKSFWIKMPPKRTARKSTRGRRAYLKKFVGAHEGGVSSPLSSQEDVSPPLPSPTPAQAPTAPQEEPVKEESVPVVDLSAEDEAMEDTPPQSMGWTVKEYYKPHFDVPSHHRLMVLLNEYYADWKAKVEYVCAEYTHPLEETYWNTKVNIFVKNEEKDAHEPERVHFHWGHHDTMTVSIEDAAVEACLALRGHRFDAMSDNVEQFIPYWHKEMTGGWAITDPKDEEPVLRATAYHVHSLMSKVRHLEVMLIAKGKAHKRLQHKYDDLLEKHGEPRIYDKLDYKFRP